LILKIGVGGQVHVDIYGECVVRQVGIIIVKTTANPKEGLVIGGVFFII
jgi:hypothetical protein